MSPEGIAQNPDLEIRARERLRRLWQRGLDLLGTEMAILGGAMSWVSERHLVSTLSNSGAFGVIACGSLSADELAQEIAATFEMTDRPFGVNLITLHPALDALIEVCAEHGVGHVVLAGGLPKAVSIRRIKDAGAKVMCFAPAASLARKLVRLGVDALIVEGSEAGGHTGPVSTGVLAQEVLPVVREVPVFVAGGIGRGEAILSYLEMGAAGCQMGTRFICASESIAHPEFKKTFLRANARDAVLSMALDSRFPVIPVRAIANEATREFLETQRRVIERFNAREIDQKAAQLEIEHFWAGSLRRAIIEGDVQRGSVMAGQSVGMVTSEQPVVEILAELVEQAVAALVARAAASGDRPVGDA